MRLGVYFEVWDNSRGESVVCVDDLLAARALAHDHPNREVRVAVRRSSPAPVRAVLTDVWDVDGERWRYVALCEWARCDFETEGHYRPGVAVKWFVDHALKVHL